MQSVFRQALSDAKTVLDTVLSDTDLLARAAGFAGSMASALQAGGKILICGNGGSAADAMHFAEELTGRYRKNRPALAALSLADPTHITCVANDFGFEQVFARSVEAFGRPGDVLLLLSTSGNSPNLVNAVTAADHAGMKTMALLGRGGGKLAGLCCDVIIVPGDTSDRIQELHMLLLHIFVESIERLLFPDLYPDQPTG